MRLTVIGCSGSYPGPDSPASCYLLEAAYSDEPGEGGSGERTFRVLLDLGSGALGVLQRYADPLAIDAVLLSHLHADHCLDLCGYHVLRRYHPSGHQALLPVWGPPDTPGRMARAYDLDEDPGMTEEFDFRPWASGEPVHVGPFTVTPVAVAHPVDAFGLRIEADGCVLAYTGDTAPCAELTDLAAGADLLRAEASFRDGDDNPPGVHLTGLQCGEVAAAGHVGRLVITHVPPWFDAPAMLAEARRGYAGRSELAAVGATYDIPLV